MVCEALCWINETFSGFIYNLYRITYKNLKS